MDVLQSACKLGELGPGRPKFVWLSAPGAGFVEAPDACSKAECAVSISSPFIKRPVATSLLAAAFLLVGLVCYFQLPVSALPEVDFPTLQVSASLPGASPQTMASNVATPLER